MQESPQWLQTVLLVILAFILGRWTARRGDRESRRYRHPPQPVMHTAPADSDQHRIGAGVDVPNNVGGAAIDTGLETNLRDLLHAGRKIDAIKLARERLGLGLKEAKDLVERL